MSAREAGGSLNSLRRLSDEELARTAAGGDEGAARVLLERFEEPLYRYTLALVRDADLAREATWSALFEAARAVRVDDYSEPVKPWLFRVAHTAADVAGGRPNGAAEHDEAGARVTAAAPEDRERLETLLAGLDELPARDVGSLLLRELVGLEYAGIATVTGARASAARQSVFRARLALQGNPDPPTEHCDEIRAAMSKAEIDVRGRHSVASHLEDCPVCEDFARALETRPDDLRTLFPAPDEPLAAELVPPLPPVPAGARPAEPAAVGAAAISPVEERPERDRRRAIAALAVAVLLVGAGIATALALNDNGGGDKGKARAARETSTAATGRQRTAPPEAEEKSKGEGRAKPGGGEKGGGAAKGGANGGSAEGGSAGAGGSAKGAAGGGSAKGATGGGSAKGGSANGGSANGATEGGSASGSGSKSGSQEGGSTAKSGAGSASGSPSAASGEKSGSAGSGAASGATGTEAGAPGSSTEAQQAEAAAAQDTVPRTGLDVSLLVVIGLAMLAVGISLRRVYAEL